MIKYDLSIIGQISQSTQDEALLAISKAGDGVVEFSVFIDSPGGEVYPGIRIRSALASLKDRGVSISMYAGAELKSIAEHIFTIGDIRAVDKNTSIVIHSPTSLGQDASYYEALSKELTNVKKVLFDAHRAIASTDIQDSTIMDSLSKETFITADEYLKMGYATDIKDIKHENSIKSSCSNGLLIDNLNKKMENKSNLLASISAHLEETGKKILDLIHDKKGVSDKSIVSMVLQDINGTKIDFPDLMDGQTPSVGDKAFVNGGAKDSVHIMPDGSIIRISKGVVSDIIEPSGLENLFKQSIEAADKIKDLDNEKMQLKDGLIESKNNIEELKNKISQLYSEQASNLVLNSSNNSNDYIKTDESKYSLKLINKIKV